MHCRLTLVGATGLTSTLMVMRSSRMLRYMMHSVMDKRHAYQLNCCNAPDNPNDKLNNMRGGAGRGGAGGSHRDSRESRAGGRLEAAGIGAAQRGPNEGRCRREIEGAQHPLQTATIIHDHWPTLRVGSTRMEMPQGEGENLSKAPGAHRYQDLRNANL